MKRAGNLFRKITEIENLELAFWKAQRGKSGKKEVIDFRANLSQNLQEVRCDLLSGDYMVGDYHFFVINDPKERKICAASFQERVLHHAIINVCEPYFEKYQIYDSYACRKGKGVDACLSRTRFFCHKFKRYLKLDIHKYFDSICHETLFSLLEHHFKDAELLQLFQRLLDSYETMQGHGLPIGNLTSQYFANMYIGMLDHEIKDRLKISGYVRYMDDFIIFADSQRDIVDYQKSTEDFVQKKLHLTLNLPQSNLTQSGITFLSYRVLPDKLRLSLKAKRRFRRKMAMASKTENVEKTLPLLAFAKRADCAGFLKTVFYGTTPKARSV